MQMLEAFSKGRALPAEEDEMLQEHSDQERHFSAERRLQQERLQGLSYYSCSSASMVRRIMLSSC